ncbi:MAG: lysine--tRNA ligase, partial [Candidatus Cloacimonadota bacterium]|nr:lysine--tRNA ligase [Candidatus Cloacimonadota bacterium]
MDNLNQLLAIRRQKLKKLKERQVNPYPNRAYRSHKIEMLWQNKDKFAEQEKEVTITGRLDAMRRQGKIGFGNVSDDSGRIQIFVRKDKVGEENYEIYKLLDLGDFVQISGECFITKRGEYSVRASNVKILSKNLKPLPIVKEKVVDGKKKRYDEFSDIELRYRKRYLDLLLNPGNKEIFITRAKIIRSIREFLDKRDFLEVETPILQPLYGGANARPFVTHHNTLDIPFYLRIATELYLKRLLVGGMEKVYELGKNFRNEGMDKTHNPEFTALEVYEAYSDLEKMMELTEDMINFIAKTVLKTEKIKFQDKKIDLAKPWRRASMLELIKEETGFDASDFDLEKIQAFCRDNEIEFEESNGTGKLIEEIFSEKVEANLIQPTFVTDFPKEVSPLAKEKPENPRMVERFEVFINGNEYGNAFTELNDPLEQRKRLEAQAKLREMG